MCLTEDDQASRAAEFHHRALIEPYVSLSTYTAPSTRPFRIEKPPMGEEPRRAPDDAGRTWSPKKKPDADAHSQASGFRYGLYEIPGINV